MKKKIGIIGQFPPPMHGLSKALDTLYNSRLNEKYNLIKIDITNNKKFIANLFNIMFNKLDLYYLTISQSKFGNIRDLIIIKLIQLKKKKVIIHLHGGGFRNILDKEFNILQKKLNYRILSKVNAGIVLGDSLKYIFNEIIPNDKIYIVNNCVDDEYIMNDFEFNRKINDLNNINKITILYLSNFIEEKGYKKVLELAKLVRVKKYNNFAFIFAGKFFNSKDKQDFFEYISKYNLDEIICYKGVVDGEEKLKILKECNIFMLLTNYKNEGQPISIIEGMANGLRIVTTDVQGIRDLVNSETAYIYKYNRIEIEKLLNDISNFNKNTFNKILKKNRRKIMSSFKKDDYIKNLDKIFETILGEFKK